jgi:hypothetical protein
MGAFIDMTGDTFGELIVLSRYDVNRDRIRWLCRCSCGKEKPIRGASLRSGASKTCGCNKSNDLIGQKFGQLIVINKVDDMWNCLCDCGNFKIATSHGLKRLLTIHCGCNPKYSTNSNNLLGLKFNRLLVIEKRTERNKDRSLSWICKCDCGNIKSIDGRSLMSKRTQSCGCLHIEKLKANCGINHHCWNKELSDVERELRIDRREDGSIIRWRNMIFNRDMYKCKICCSKKKLNAHHLDSWHCNPEKRYNIDNGITLCTRCHKEFHKLYSNKNNTAEEFFEYYIIRKFQTT